MKVFKAFAFFSFICLLSSNSWALRFSWNSQTGACNVTCHGSDANCGAGNMSAGATGSGYHCSGSCTGSTDCCANMAQAACPSGYTINNFFEDINRARISSNGSTVQIDSVTDENGKDVPWLREYLGVPNKSAERK